MLFLFQALATLAMAAPYAARSYDSSYADIEPRHGKTCKTDGALVCSSDGSHFAICNFGHAVFQPTSSGTICVCSGGEHSQCTIASVDNSLEPEAPLAPPAASPAPTPSSHAHKHSHAHQHSSHGHKPSPHPHKLSSHHAPVPPAYTSPPTPAPSPGSTTYKTYLGDGSPSQGWPTLDQWVSFDHLWTSNQGHITASCAAFNEPNNSPSEIAAIRSAILSESKTCGVDPRLALAMMLQESGGCVRVPTTNYGVNNPGLFQSHNGPGTCADASPCTDSEIVQMVKDGISGTADGDGLKGVIAQAKQEGYEGVAADYAGLRIYNSGSIAASGQLQDGIATHCYVSDIANRLVGWTSGTTGCTLDG